MSWRTLGSQWQTCTLIVENEEKNKHQNSQEYRRQDVVWGGVDIKTGLYTKQYVYKPINICWLGGLW